MKVSNENKEFIEKFFKEKIFIQKDQKMNFEQFEKKDYTNYTQFGGGLGDYLQASDKEKLSQIAYAIENYIRNGTQLMGGLHDYTQDWNEHNYREYILQKVREHEELNNVEQIEDLLNLGNDDKGDFKKTEQLGYLAERGFDLNNEVEKHLYSLDKDQLSQLAMKLETYHKKENNEHFLGGIHDYVFRLDEEEIRNYIRKEIKEHEDLNNVEKLNSLIN